jgi:simple sugar transport system ATP-binding protein
MSFEAMKVEFKYIYKYFGPIHANDGVSMTVESGALHGILGENGAGKSTLMKVLFGFISSDRGEILLDGTSVQMTSPAQAMGLGIGMLQQDPLDFPSFRVLDNFLLGCPGKKVLDRAQARKDLISLSAQFDFNLDADALVSSLSIGERQQLEIIRLLWLGVRLLILDEPTTAISAQQKVKLFAALRKLAEGGKTVIFVSHKLEEIEELCSRVTVMAHGKVVGEVSMPCRRETLVQMMFGRDITGCGQEVTLQRKVLLKLHSLTVSDWRMELKDLSLEVQAGEIIGLAGLEGSGQKLVLKACAGLLRPLKGEVRIDNIDMTGRPYREFKEAGIAYMPGGRLEEGLIPGMTLIEHRALIERDHLFFVNWKMAEREAVRCIEDFKIKGQPTTYVEELSGGNQQRMLLALLPSEVKLLLMEHPTRGLDIESTGYIWGMLCSRARLGTTILFTSSDLDELLIRSNRILVFFNGRVREINAGQGTVTQLGELIGGIGFESFDD